MSHTHLVLSTCCESGFRPYNDDHAKSSARAPTVWDRPDLGLGRARRAFPYVVVLQAGFSANEELIENIQQHVRGRLAPYEYPREIEFIDALPMTTTGKVQRKELRKREERAQQQAKTGQT